MRKIATLATALLVMMPVAGRAQPPSDTQVWVMGLATVPVREHWRVHIELQPRASVEEGMTTEVLTRLALGRRVTQRATVWAGYAWVAKPPGPGVVHEHRAWQQLSLTAPSIAGWTPSLRLRLEQRTHPGWDGLSHRVRALSRLVRPVTPDRRWSAVAWHEGFLTVDRTPGGPARGIDQHRVFGGILRQLSSALGLEAGYLWRTIRQPGIPRTQTHSAFVWFNLTP